MTSPGQIAGVARPPAGRPLYALLESALGVERAYPIAAAHPALRGIALGEADLRADLGVHGDAGLDWSRSRVVVAARAAGLAAAVAVGLPGHPGPGRTGRRPARTAAPWASSAAPRSTRASCPSSSGRTCPTERELEEAETIVKAASVQPGAQALPDGRFVDAAVVATARRTLSLARRPVLP